ncbi:MAG: mannose-1-phosphate guanylyltransferase [Candidatus Cloacimonas sp. 4484_275]|nr:MAG: mannose-1-phosphate guanylyltransferase [Candidatus Cloacimonas sp. 4484_275]
MIALIMAGGIGSRFWPLSRESNPKQFLKIVSEKSMIQMTVERLLPKIRIDDIYIVTSASQTKLVKKHLPDLPEENIIIEPFGMNTAPCIALSAEYLARKYDSSEKMIVLAADHLIKNTREFLRTLEIAVEAAEKDFLVTFGIKPNYPATGYGYIEAGRKIADEMFVVKQFKEKPDLKTAERFLQAGNFFWNSGMFAWKLETILKAYHNYLPEVSGLLEQISRKWKKIGIQADISEEYARMPKLPVDIGIMEKAEKRIVIPVDYGWSDVGSWKALYDISAKDKNENVLKAENIVLESNGNYVNSRKLVTLIGVENLVVVETDDAILISARDKSEDVKKVVNILKEKKLQKYL